MKLHIKWNFRKIRAETTAAQSVIIEDLKTNYIRAHGLALAVEDVRPTKRKEERIDATLEPRYAGLTIWHTRGGNCELLEEELTQQNPAHDDIKDALASAVEISTPPSFMGLGSYTRSTGTKAKPMDYVNTRFGGIG